LDLSSDPDHGNQPVKLTLTDVAGNSASLSAGNVYVGDPTYLQTLPSQVQSPGSLDLSGWADPTAYYEVQFSDNGKLLQSSEGHPYAHIDPASGQFDFPVLLNPGTHDIAAMFLPFNGGPDTVTPVQSVDVVPPPSGLKILNGDAVFSGNVYVLKGTDSVAGDHLAIYFDARHFNYTQTDVDAHGNWSALIQSWQLKPGLNTLEVGGQAGTVGTTLDVEPNGSNAPVITGIADQTGPL